MAAAKMNYGYGESENGRYVLSRGGKELMRGTENELWNYLHHHTSLSVHRALRDEGYSISPEKTA